MQVGASHQLRIRKRDDVLEDESQEQASNTIDATSASSFSQRLISIASSSAIGSLPSAARKLVSVRRIRRSLT